MKHSLLSFMLILALNTESVLAADWPHINGIQHDRTSTEYIEIDWKGKGPKQNWRITCNGGFSSFVLGNGGAFTVLKESVGGEDREVLLALDRTTGKRVWKTVLGKAPYDGGGERGTPDNSGGDGPRATAVVDGEQLFVYGSRFELFCLDSETGDLKWSRDILNEFDGTMIKWQNAMSPIVMKDRVIVSGGGAGQAFLAFKREDGSLLWKTGEGTVSHATPVLTQIDGIEQVLFMVRNQLVSLDPRNGKELWNYPFTIGTSMAASPVVWENLVHITAGYGIGGACIEVGRSRNNWSATELWHLRGNTRAASIWSTPVAHDGFLYGFYSHKEYGSGAFKCLDMRTGKEMWQKEGFGLGQLIMSGEKLFAVTDFGRLHAIAPNSKKYTEIEETDIIDGKCWSTPAISNGQIFIRSTIAGVAYDL